MENGDAAMTPEIFSRAREKGRDDEMPPEKNKRLKN